MHSQCAIHLPNVSNNETAIKLLAKGKKHNSNKKFDDAVHVLKLAHRYFCKHEDAKDPSSEYAETTYFLGCSYKEKYDYDMAIRYLKQAYRFYLRRYEINNNKENDETLIYLINCTLDLIESFDMVDKIDSAIPYLEEIETKILCFIHLENEDDANVDLKDTISKLYLLLAEESEALLEKKEYYLKQSLRFDPSIAVQIKLGIVHLQNNHFDAALECLLLPYEVSTELLNREPNLLADAMYHLGRCRLALGDFFNAIQNFEFAYAAYHQLGDQTAGMASHLGIALCHYLVGQPSKGNDHLIKVLDFNRETTSDHTSTIANQLILDLCLKAGFPLSFNLANPHLHHLNIVFRRITETEASENEFSRVRKLA